MSNRTAMVVALAMSASICGGCGTVENLRDATPPKKIENGSSEEWKAVYGGVRQDLACLNQSKPALKPYQTDPILTLYDIPLSFIGDTLTLPYTISYEMGLFGSALLFEPQDYAAAINGISTVSP